MDTPGLESMDKGQIKLTIKDPYLGDNPYGEETILTWGMTPEVESTCEGQEQSPCEYYSGDSPGMGYSVRELQRVPDRDVPCDRDAYQVIGGHVQHTQG